MKKNKFRKKMRHDNSTVRAYANISNAFLEFNELLFKCNPLKV